MAAGTYTVERSTVIAAPPERVYGQIADFHSWPRWSPVSATGPAAVHATLTSVVERPSWV